nr:hypothetical protein [Salinicola halophyticus]
MISISGVMWRLFKSVTPNPESTADTTPAMLPQVMTVVKPGGCDCPTSIAH